jgi:hypothetical protein
MSIAAAFPHARRKHGVGRNPKLVTVVTEFLAFRRDNFPQAGSPASETRSIPNLRSDPAGVRGEEPL